MPKAESAPLHENTFLLDIEWDRPSPDSPKLPSLVGPFATRAEAQEWARLNIGSGSWECRPLAYPYYRGGHRA